jgi:zinc-ribbon domain
MFCDHCGASITAGQNFCSQCGKQLVAEVHPHVQEPGFRPARAALPPFATRVERHTRILAILWLAVSIFFGVIPAFWFFFGSSIAMHFIPFPMRAFLLPIAGIIGALLAAGGVAGIVAGWGLLKYRPWARVLALVLGVIALVRIPFGTVLGIYTLWVLLPAESEQEYRRLARTAC